MANIRTDNTMTNRKTNNTMAKRERTKGKHHSSRNTNPTKTGGKLRRYIQNTGG
jgi:hypothetical protein